MVDEAEEGFFVVVGLPEGFDFDVPVCALDRGVVGAGTQLEWACVGAVGGDEVGEAAVGGVDFPGEDFAWDGSLGRAVERNGAWWWWHEEPVAEHGFGELWWWRWRKHEDLVAEHGLGAVWWCCGAEAIGEHAARGGDGGSVGG